MLYLVTSELMEFGIDLMVLVSEEFVQDIVGKHMIMVKELKAEIKLPTTYRGTKLEFVFR